MLEIVQLEIVPGAEEAFAAAYHRACHLVAATPGCRTMRLTRGVERPSTFVLLTEWDSIEAHESFRASDRFAPWRAEVGPHFASDPVVAHVTDVRPDRSPGTAPQRSAPAPDAEAPSTGLGGHRP